MRLYFTAQAGRYFLPKRLAKMSTSFSRTFSEKTVEPVSEQKGFGLKMKVEKERKNHSNFKEKPNKTQ